METHVNDLMIEVTRKCNLECAHCLRGCAEDKVIHPHYMERLLDHITSISSVCFSGGEPSLHPEIIRKFIEICRAKEIEVQNFDISTNNLKHSKSDEFCMAIIALWTFCTENEFSVLRLSNDKYHVESNWNDLPSAKLDIFSFTTNQFPEPGSKMEYPIRQGYQAEHFGTGTVIEPGMFELFDDLGNDSRQIGDNQLYLNAEGFIIAGCDWSYESQRENKDIILGHVYDLGTVFQGDDCLAQMVKKHNTKLGYEYAIKEVV